MVVNEKELSDYANKYNFVESDNPNDLANYWGVICSDGESDFNVPNRTYVITMSPAIIGAMMKCCDNPKDSEEYEDFITKSLIHELREFTTFDLDKPLFIKLGTTAYKFDFANNCYLTDINNIGKQAFEMFYNALLCGAGAVNHLIVRDYIESDDDEFYIYNGMPLRDELRVFVNFEEKRIERYTNYWNASEMNRLNPTGQSVDVAEKALAKYSSDDSPSFVRNNLSDWLTWKKWSEQDSRLTSQEMLDMVKDSFNELFENVNGDVLGASRWSMDFMFVRKNGVVVPYLIDCAYGAMSALNDVAEIYESEMW